MSRWKKKLWAKLLYPETARALGTVRGPHGSSDEESKSLYTGFVTDVGSLNQPQAFVQRKREGEALDGLCLLLTTEEQTDVWLLVMNGHPVRGGKGWHHRWGALAPRGRSTHTSFAEGGGRAAVWFPPCSVLTRGENCECDQTWPLSVLRAVLYGEVGKWEAALILKSCQGQMRLREILLFISNCDKIHEM